MANIIKPKRSNSAGVVPTTGNLTSGELGVNMADKKIYINNGTSVVQVGAGNLSALSDVVLTAPSNGQFLSYNGTNWVNATGAGTGDVVGAASSTDNAIVRWDGTTGKLIQNSTATIDDNGNFANVNAIGFDTTPGTLPTATGSMYWDAGNGSPSIVLDADVSLQVGQEMLALVYNGTGSTITNGSVVAVSGAQGQRPSVVLADADSEPLSAGTLGIATEDIANGAEGFVTTFGFVRGLNTSAFTAGAPIYLSQTAGAFTATRPSAPAHTVALGWVIKVNASSGEVFVNINNGWELDELHNVLITSPASGNTLIYDASVGVWKNANLTDGTGITITEGAGSITITNSGVTSAVAGTGISVSGATGAVTITNTGVTSAVAGTGITVSGATGAVTVTNDDRGSSQNIFKNIAVAGQSTVVADSNDDTLTFAAGTGITITTNATTDTVTIAGTGGTVTSVATGTGLTGGTITTSGTISLANTAVTAGSYTYASITVDAQGRITAASSGATPQAFPSGTAMLFVQTSAPTGWTKSTTHDNKALRVVSGTASSGGSVAFTTAFASQSVTGSVSVTVSAGTLAVGAGTLATGNTTATGSVSLSSGGSVSATTLATSQIPAHNHTTYYSINRNINSIYDTRLSNSGENFTDSSNVLNTGGGGSHTHGFTNPSYSFSGNAHNHTITGSPSLSGSPSVTAQSFTGNAINMAVQYVDVIIATKD